VLDEPTNGLDPQGIRELRDYLRQLTRTEGITVFVSSHLLSEMELMCDRVAIIQSGRLVDIKQLKNTGEEVQKAEIAFEVNDAEQAYALAGAGRVEGNQLLLHLEREQIAEMNSLLAANGIKVYAIRPVARTLEDQFLEVTGGGVIG
jgi:ABC-2 type transport system ATP-binding protein